MFWPNLGRCSVRVAEGPPLLGEFHVSDRIADVATPASPPTEYQAPGARVGIRCLFTEHRISRRASLYQITHGRCVDFFGRFPGSSVSRRRPIPPSPCEMQSPEAAPLGGMRGSNLLRFPMSHISPIPAVASVSPMRSIVCKAPTVTYLSTSSICLISLLPFRIFRLFLSTS